MTQTQQTFISCSLNCPRQVFLGGGWGISPQWLRAQAHFISCRASSSSCASSNEEQWEHRRGTPASLMPRLRNSIHHQDAVVWSTCREAGTCRPIVCPKRRKDGLVERGGNSLHSVQLFELACILDLSDSHYTWAVLWVENEMCLDE